MLHLSEFHSSVVRGRPIPSILLNQFHGPDAVVEIKGVGDREPVSFGKKQQDRSTDSGARPCRLYSWFFHIPDWWPQFVPLCLNFFIFNMGNRVDNNSLFSGLL